MTWLDDLQGCESLKTFIQHTVVPILVSTPAGSILWANAAFTNWSGYSLSELQRYGWKQITVPGDELDQDISKAERMDEFTPVYSQQKQFYRKNQSAAWGIVTPMRFPPYGEVEFCVVTWLPSDDVANKAIETVMACAAKAEAASTAMAKQLALYTQISDEQRFLMNAVTVASKHPRVTWAIFGVGLGILGLNNALEILKTATIIPEPPRSVVQDTKPTP